MHLSFLPLLTLALGVLANAKSTLSETKFPYPSTIVDGNGTTLAVEVRRWLDSPPPAKIKPRSKSGGFYDECQDVRFYFGKADDEDPNVRGMNKGYKTSPWLVARCPNKKGELVCTWLELGKCMVNVEGGLFRGANGKFHQSCTQCFLNKSNFQCRCWSEPDKDTKRLTESLIDLNTLVANRDGHLYCHDGWGVADYCTGRTSDNSMGEAVTCWAGVDKFCGQDDF